MTRADIGSAPPSTPASGVLTPEGPDGSGPGPRTVGPGAGEPMQLDRLAQGEHSCRELES